MSMDPRAEAPPVLRLELAEPVPAQVPVGADVLLRVRVAGAARDLSGGRLEVVAGGEIVATAVVIRLRDNFNENATFAVSAPRRGEAFIWTIRFPPQEIGGIRY